MLCAPNAKRLMLSSLLFLVPAYCLPPGMLRMCMYCIVITSLAFHGTCCSTAHRLDVAMVRIAILVGICNVIVARAQCNLDKHRLSVTVATIGPLVALMLVIYIHVSPATHVVSSRHHIRPEYHSCMHLIGAIGFASIALFPRA